MSDKYKVIGSYDDIMAVHSCFIGPSNETPRCYFVDAINFPSKFALTVLIELTEEDVIMTKLRFNNIILSKM